MGEPHHHRSFMIEMSETDERAHEMLSEEIANWVWGSKFLENEGKEELADDVLDIAEDLIQNSPDSVSERSRKILKEDYQ